MSFAIISNCLEFTSLLHTSHVINNTAISKFIGNWTEKNNFWAFFLKKFRLKVNRIYGRTKEHNKLLLSSSVRTNNWNVLLQQWRRLRRRRCDCSHGMQTGTPLNQTAPVNISQHQLPKAPTLTYKNSRLLSATSYPIGNFLYCCFLLSFKYCQYLSIVSFISSL